MYHSIEFDQFLKIVKNLPYVQLKRLKAQSEKGTKCNNLIELEALLMNGQTATPRQVEKISGNRKAFNQWRTR